MNKGERAYLALMIVLYGIAGVSFIYAAQYHQLDYFLVGVAITLMRFPVIWWIEQGED